MDRQLEIDSDRKDTMRLVYEDGIHTIGGAEVKVGDVCSTFRDELVEVKYITEPHKPSSTGRVGVRFLTEPEHGVSEFFPSVINAKWVEREDR